MLLLFRNTGIGCSPTKGSAAAFAGAGGLLLLAAGGARSAEIYYQPTVQLSTAYNDNVNLEPGTKQGAEGYYATASTMVGIATPNSETNLEPHLVYNYYPTVDGLNRLEGFLNMNSRYSWQRDRFNITGYYDHRDDNNAAQPAATETNPTEPGGGSTTPSSGRIFNNTVRDWLTLDPTFTHLLTPLSAIGVGAEYQRLDYSPADTSSHIPFNYYLGRVFYSWTQTQRMDLTVTGFASKYLAGTIDSTSTTGGVQGEMKYSWSQTLQSNLSAAYDRTKYDETDPRVFQQSSNQWAASLSTTYSGQITKYRASIGRSINPGAQGGLYVTDQVQAQYDRELSQRMHLTTAIRAFKDRTVNIPNGNDTRTYVTPFVKLQYMMTRQIFVAGSYNFIYQKYKTDPEGAQANRISITFGYIGLGRQR